MGLYDCAAAFAAPRSTSAAVKPAMIHLFFIFTLSAIFAHRPRSKRKRKGWTFLVHGCARQPNSPQDATPEPLFRELSGPVLPQSVTPVQEFRSAGERTCTDSPFTDL